ncbi:cytochrome P450 monooxygenase [Colletotrichum higginsianum]|uniref:Cytochrome P450 monooxygenase n=2 Tax=Colletotrichum higginsianum TaxID=80884 RepID=H1V7V6_COLHI|nr:Cytochrome P450 monooxygenase [Colletotrichum higginsianum IMI 349063]OBR04195.1 Cytochrome P450 monooxygenase [Colletotrichum higginsianum IMI 349063]TIC90321.1 Isotrichodermin C-15 hydroxylase [Colletotrichum higginsianum]CCF36308.1 cytochrome P450 monooxygenase [Colletotrichum higginsianum]
MPPHDTLSWPPRATVTVPILAIILGVVYAAWSIIYNLYFSPLSRIPGPKLWAVSKIPNSLMRASGHSVQKVLDLHKKYGSIVRLAPDEVSFVDPGAWNDTMGHRKSGQQENGKHPVFYGLSGDAVIGADREKHGRLRRLLSHGFSAQSMIDQQPLIRQYVDKLIQRLHEKCGAGATPVDMEAWYNYTTFDIIGDLTFGEPFGCLNNSGYHPWVALIASTMKHSANLYALRRVFPRLESLVSRMLTMTMSGSLAQHMEVTRTKMQKRLDLGMYRPDFTEAMIRRQGTEKLTFSELQDNASLLMIAGSETTATVLTGVTYYLLKNPEILAKLTEEVSTSYTSEDEIDLVSVQKLTYMLAVLNETLRIYPPIPTAQPRVVPSGGSVVCEKFLPAGTTVGLWFWPIHHYPGNFSMPDDFIPERWMGDERFVDDRTDAFQPFSFGSRNCIGRNLAYAEMRMILARIVWNFDLRPTNESLTWMERNEAFNLWEKPALNVHLTPRKREE